MNQTYAQLEADFGRYEDNLELISTISRPSRQVHHHAATVH
ncbi:hypothetical protein [Marivita sp. S2033]